jgi:hypothetical protein
MCAGAVFRRPLRADPSRGTAMLPLQRHQRSTCGSPTRMPSVHPTRPAPSPPTRRVKGHGSRCLPRGKWRGVEPCRSISVPRMAGIGASRPLPSASTKVRLLNRLPTLHLGGGDYSSCPIVAIRRHHRDRRKRVVSRPPQGLVQIPIRSPRRPRRAAPARTSRPAPSRSAGSRSSEIWSGSAPAVRSAWRP